MYRLNSVCLLLVLHAVVCFTEQVPSIPDGAVQNLHVYEGSNALLTCIIRDAGNYTVLWMKEDRIGDNIKISKILTAAYDLVTTDTRFAVMHDHGGDVWVLVIKDVKLNDTGMYICEVNSRPVVQSFHQLKVLSRGLLPPDNQTDSSIYETHKVQLINIHNYTDCCFANNVSQSCFGFCNIHSILEGNTGQDPENCENDFAAIVRCMADGRNHVPCCIQEGVPDICQDVCKGEYTMISDNIKTHFSCSAYTEKTLACIVDGIEYLPSSPENVEVESLTQSSLEVSWDPSLSNADTITKYIINVTMIIKLSEGNFYEDDYDFFDTANATILQSHNLVRNTTQIKVSRTQSNYVIKDLNPLTMYEITVTAHNSHGSSLPSYAVRALTKMPGVSKTTNISNPPDLPDIKTCCAEKGISHKTCIDKMCEPTLADLTSVTDLMICAPWVESTFSCLVNGIDHTPCCKARGLPLHCQKLCASNVSHIDYSYFKCLKYMGEYTNCLMQGYGVLPSAPRQIHLSHVYVNFAIIQWEPPEHLGQTVPYYNIHYRLLKPYDFDYNIIHKVNSPFILENLESDTFYEVFVEAVNTYGVGEPSSIIKFSTIKREVQDKLDEAASPFYNVTACCVEAGLNRHCLPLCSYDASITNIKALAGVCGGQLSTLIRCGAGGRNHTSCCTRRGVPSSCLPICSGVILGSLMTTASTCIPFIGNIVQCFEEGSEILPGPINEFHATEITNTSVTLEWETSTDSNNTDYVVFYQEVENATVPENFFKNKKEINTTSTKITIKDLVTRNFYKFYVLSRNQHGTSLPSSVLIIQVLHSVLGERSGYGVPSPPHSLAMSSHSATWVTISWQPPEFSLPTEQLYYKLHHKTNSEVTFRVVETSLTSHNLVNLKPNSKYIVYVIAVSDKGQSLPSETLIAWTDPAFPAFVEPPTIHPNNLVIEGSNMTVLCIALGAPMPTVSLYINGRFVHQETTRHMVTLIQNVSRDMDQISCYADNGYGTPMQAFRKIRINHVPHIIASGITMAALGDSVTLECQVDSYPEPKMIFWRDYTGRVPVIQGGKYNIKILRSKDGNEATKFIMNLDINKISNVDEGEYFCHAENAFGSATQAVSVRIRNTPSVTNISQCCIEQQVTSPCMEACSFYLDIDAVINKPECIGDFDKLMRCAADGSDHRTCCGHSGVPRECLDWCRGHSNLNNTYCVLTYTKKIMNCFQEGRDRLPGPPQNLSFVLLDSSTGLLKWDPPIKNPSTVEIYKVIWNKKDSINFVKNDTKNSSLVLTGLEQGITYEYTVKAVNNRGMSIKSNIIEFTINDEYITTLANMQNNSSHAGIAVAIIFGVLVLIILIVFGVWVVRRKLMGRKSPGGVAFENPSYLREVNMDHIQISPGQNQENTPSSSTNNGTSNPTTQGWKHETLHVPLQSTEIPPTLYEELKLGQDGVGFKRLK